MQLRIFTEPQQGASYATLRAVAQHAETTGFDAFFRSDHYLAMSGDGMPGPSDAWTTLAGLARDTSTIRLGTLVSSATFRLPGPLAITVANVDEMSAGRIELGLGAGWFDAEHAAYGIPFPDTRERFDRFTEQLEIITGLWAAAPGGRFGYAGTHYQLADSPALPKPVQTPSPPIIIGGAGKKRTPALAARFAAEFNVPFSSAEATGQAFARVRQAAIEIGRDPDSIVYSVALVACVGRTDAEVATRAGAIGRGVDDLRVSGATGTPAQVVDTLHRFRDLGASRVYLQILDLTDLAHLDLIAAEVLPAVR